MGFLDLRYHGLSIKGCRLMSGKNGHWIALPQREGKDENGELKYYDQLYLSPPEADHVRRLVLLDLERQGHIGGAAPANGITAARRPTTHGRGGRSHRTPEGEDLSDYYSQPGDEIPF